MSKIAAYLQEHIQGEVTTNPAVLKAFAIDGSVLEILPEMAVYPRVTSDIRKVTRFAWQLADKGHILPITPRGSGSDQTGGALGKGVILSLPAHMNRIFEFEPKQKLIRLQPGVSAKSLSDALSLHGMAVPPFTPPIADTTAGGLIGAGVSGPLGGRFGGADQWIHQLEIVLASGDILQTERLSKRDLSKKKGLTGFEGEIYRQLDSLITDNQQLIEDKLTGYDGAGYANLAKVKQKDGSLDLAPLFVGSQGTLGIISEMILKVEFVSKHTAAAVITFTSHEAARDAIDHITALEPAFLEYFDSEFFQQAAARGKTYDFYQAAGQAKVVLLVGFKDFSERSNAKKLKKMTKHIQGEGVQITSAIGEAGLALEAVRNVCSYLLLPTSPGTVVPALFDGIYIPRERLEDFLRATAALAAKHSVSLPVYGQMLDNLLFTRPALQPHKVGDKQKIFKLLDEFTTLITQHGGSLIGTGSEGRVKAPFAYRQLDDEVIELFKAVKNIFDPYGILNPGVKQTSDIRQLIGQLRSTYDKADKASYIPAF